MPETRPSICLTFALRLALATTVAFNVAATLPSAAAVPHDEPSSSRPSAFSDMHASASHGTVALADGVKVSFDAFAGHITIGASDQDEAALVSSGRDTEIVSRGTAVGGPPRASMSYVAYIRTGVDQHHRPLLFLYDGGPGSSSRGLVMASFGPVAVEVPGPLGMSAVDFRIANNPACLLDVADLVFIDAPGTGFGDIHRENAAARFYGIDGDADAFSRFIERFAAIYDRIDSPIFLFGHSYGTVRTAVLTRRLMDDDIDPAGIVAVSQWLNIDDFLDSAPANPGTDNPYVFALPTYAATSWYFHRIPDRSIGLDALIAKAQDFATHGYAEALYTSADLSPNEDRVVGAQLQSLTGIAADTWIDARFRISGAAFSHLLLAERHQVLGRLDTRYVGTASNPLVAGTEAGGDPFSAQTSPVIAAAMARYARDTLKLNPTLSFSPFADVPDLKWNNDHVTTGKPWESFFNVVPDLAAAMTGNPRMHILVMGGRFDLATTFFAATEEMKRLPVPSALAGNISYAFYPTGHEPYLDDTIRRAMHDRIVTFIEGSLAR